MPFLALALPCLVLAFLLSGENGLGFSRRMSGDNSAFSLNRALLAAGCCVDVYIAQLYCTLEIYGKLRQRSVTFHLIFNSFSADFFADLGIFLADVFN